MEIAVIGTGFIGSTLGRALAAAGQQVTFGSRHPGDDAVAGGTSATFASVADAMRARKSSSWRCPAQRSPA